MGKQIIYLIRQISTNLYEAKYQSLINKHDSTGLKYFNYSKVFIEYFYWYGWYL